MVKSNIFPGRLNEGMFAGSGGYILKPEGYRGEKPTVTSTAATTTTTTTKPQEVAPTTTNPQEVAPQQQKQPSPPQAHIQHRTLDLEIKVFAAQNLPLPPDHTSAKSFHPYLKVELHVEAAGERHGHFPEDGHACDPATAAAAAAAATTTTSKEKLVGDDDNRGKGGGGGEYKMHTKTSKEATRDPDFRAERLEFKGIPGVLEELSFVRFVVRDDELFQRDDLAAWACVRLDRLRLGYRFVRLMDAKGRETEGVVLIKVLKKVY